MSEIANEAPSSQTYYYNHPIEDMEDRATQPIDRTPEEEGIDAQGQQAYQTQHTGSATLVDARHIIGPHKDSRVSCVQVRLTTREPAYPQSARLRWRMSPRMAKAGRQGRCAHTAPGTND